MQSQAKLGIHALEHVAVAASWATGHSEWKVEDTAAIAVPACRQRTQRARARDARSVARFPAPQGPAVVPFDALDLRHHGRRASGIGVPVYV